MPGTRSLWWIGLVLLLTATRSPAASAAEPEIRIETPMSPPAWALLERELLRANAAACRGVLRPLLRRARLLAVRRALGRRRRAGRRHRELQRLADPARPGRLRTTSCELYKKAWEGHLRQYTLAKTTEVPFARDGMYYKEFPVSSTGCTTARG